MRLWQLPVNCYSINVNYSLLVFSYRHIFWCILYLIAEKLKMSVEITCYNLTPGTCHSTNQSHTSAHGVNREAYSWLLWKKASDRTKCLTCSRVYHLLQHRQCGCFNNSITVRKNGRIECTKKSRFPVYWFELGDSEFLLTILTNNSKSTLKTQFLEHLEAWRRYLYLFHVKWSEKGVCKMISVYCGAVGTYRCSMFRNTA